jgi:hypothetical protein
VRKPTPAEFEHWIETGTFTEDPREIGFNTSVLAIPHLNNIAEAASRRAFHLNAKGHQAMAQTAMHFTDAVYNNPDPQIVTLDYGQSTTSVQMLATMYNNQFLWWTFRGPIGIAINLCGNTRFVQILWNYADTRLDQKINDPPFVHSGTSWYVDLPEYKGPGRRCLYEFSNTNSDPCQITCGVWLVADL